MDTAQQVGGLITVLSITVFFFIKSPLFSKDDTRLFIVLLVSLIGQLLGAYLESKIDWFTGGFLFMTVLFAIWTGITLLHKTFWLLAGDEPESTPKPH